MRLELRVTKSWSRCNDRGEQYEKYWDWLTTKMRRYRRIWTRRFGRNQSGIEVRYAGYIRRRRQIVKCFMKGWCRDEY